MSTDQRPITTSRLQRLKQKGEKIVSLTAYDATFARLIDEGGVDFILVGDTLGMVVQGQETTLPVTLQDVLYHTQMVRRGIKRALLVADMPFLSYQISAEDALRNAGRLMKEGGADAVKLEGGVNIAGTIQRLVEAGIPVMGHVGMQPMKVHQYGGYKLQGQRKSQAAEITADAEAVQHAGAFAVVLEKISRGLAAELTSNLRIPTIGIASGSDCDGQILVSYDMLGLADQFNFKFVRRYLKLADDIRTAVLTYGKDIRTGNFPSEEESFE